MLIKLNDSLRKFEAFFSLLLAAVTDVPKLRRLIEGALTKRHAQLSDSSRRCLLVLASKMFSAGLISSEAHWSPSFNGIIDEFKSGMSFITERSELEDHCTKFLRACIEIRGAIAMAARALQKDWKEMGMELNID